MSSFDDKDLADAVSVRRQWPTAQAAADFMGVSRHALRRMLTRAAERGLAGYKPVMPGFAIKSVASKVGDAWVKQTKASGEEFEVAPGHTVRGESALVDSEGRVVQKWIKTKNEYAPEDVVAVLKEAFKDYPGATQILPTPQAPSNDLLTLVPCNDWHVGLYAWREEVGENWDTKIAERIIGRSIDDLLDRTPSSAEAIVLGGGDLVHADNNENKTARSGNVLEVDGRWPRVLMAASRLMVRAIDASLRRHSHVTVRILPGNHDEHSSVAVAYFLLAWYRNEPRITVDVDPSLFFWFRFGRVLLGATHGHTVKIKDMASIMAHRRAADWGATRFRYIHGFHLHHSAKFATEDNGVISEVHQAPIPQDAWHFGKGFLSGRSLQSITYHRDFGEVSRSRIAILDAANDNGRTAEEIAV